MAKKQTKKVEAIEEPLVEETVVMEAPQPEPIPEPIVVEEPRARERLTPKDEWEIKDRLYMLKGGKRPLSRTIKSAGIYYFDEEKDTKENLNIVKIKKHRLLMK